MSRVVWKSVLGDGQLGSHTLLLPEDAEIIAAGLDPHGLPCIWYVVVRDLQLRPRPPAQRSLYLSGTDHEVPQGRHLATFVWGDLVVHAWEVAA